LGSILRTKDYDEYPVLAVYQIKTSVIHKYYKVRNWVYKLLGDDMEHLLKENEE
jgi:hypothetical protein